MISHISFHSIPVTDQDRALAFWRDVMGFTVTVDADYIPGMRWIMLRPGDAETQIHLDKVETMPEREKPTIPLIAEDVPAVTETVRAAGGTITTEPQPAPWDEGTTFAMFKDSEGNLVLLASR